MVWRYRYFGTYPSISVGWEYMYSCGVRVQTLVARSEHSQTEQSLLGWATNLVDWYVLCMNLSQYPIYSYGFPKFPYHFSMGFQSFL